VTAKDFLKKLLLSFGLDVKLASPSTRKRFTFLQDYGINTVFDVGANIGQFAGEIKESLPDSWVYSFEPVFDTYQKLRVCRAARFGRFKAFNIALGNVDGEETFFRNAFTPSSSLLPQTKLQTEVFPHTKDVSTQHVKVRRLDSLISEETFPELARDYMLKLDVQGYEDRVLKGATGILQSVKVIICEVSFLNFYDTQCSFAEVYDIMRGSGFLCAGGLANYLDRNNGIPLQEDVLFVRP
jgi:FkbM family methyltransferase